MATLKVNSFASWELTRSEEESGSILNSTQKMVLQNKLADIAAAKLTLKYDSTASTVFMQQEAELVGQMGIIQWLLDTSEQVEADLRARLTGQLSTEDRATFEAALVAGNQGIPTDQIFTS
jgi:hypothetical protein